MKKYTRIFLMAICFLLIFSACAKQGDSTVPPEANKVSIRRDDPLSVAEGALAYLLDHGDVDSFMELTPYYPSAYLHVVLQAYTTLYVDVTPGKGDIEYLHYLDSNDYSWILKDMIDFLEDDAIEIPDVMRQYEFYHDINGEESENITITVGRHGNMWYVYMFDFSPSYDIPQDIIEEYEDKI